MTRLFLHDGWELTHCDALPDHPSALAKADWRPAPVPGVVQSSPFGLPREELYRETNVRSVQWMDRQYWVYRRRLNVPPVGPDQTVQLRFAGLDYRYRILLDGKMVTEEAGMFHPVSVALDALAGQSITVSVVFYPAPDPAQYHTTTKAFCGRGTDFAPALPTIGIWDEVSLEIGPALRVEEAYIETRLQNQQRALVTVHAEFSERIASGTAIVELGGTRREVPLFDANRLTTPVEVFSPRLWWPNGLGEPALHDLRITLVVPERQTETFVQRVGLREVTRRPAPGQRVEDIPAQFVINGQPFFVNGVNWVPTDSCVGDIRDAQYDRLLDQFAAGHVNLVRVWGGGLCEKRRFYERCDELGLLVFQEFPVMFRYADDAAALRQLQREAHAIVRKLRTHPAVFLFSGGNENYHYWRMLDRDEPQVQEALQWALKGINQGRPFTDREWLGGFVRRYDEPFHIVLGGVTAAEAPHCLYQNTSAMEGEGEVHGTWTWNPRIGDHRYRMYETLYDYWRAADQHLYSEASVSSIANLATIEQVTAAPPQATDETWKLHHAFHTAWDGLRDLWLDRPSTEKVFGPITDLRELVILNQFLQAEGGRFMIEQLRRRQPHTTGVIWWGANEPWPGLAGNALIDYYGRPKLSWPWIANAFAPTILSLSYAALQPRTVEAELWLSCNDRPGFDGRYVVTAGADRYAGNCAAGYRQSIPLKRLLPTSLAPSESLTVTTQLWRDETLVHENRYFFGNIRALILAEFGKPPPP